MTSILLAGATGLVGREVVAAFESQAQEVEITLLVRSENPVFAGTKRCRQQVVDFDALDAVKAHIKGDIFICTLGTTIKTAGSKERFAQVDYGYPLALAEMAFNSGTRQMILVSSVGADATAANHYLRTKGRLEAALAEIGFAGLHILRPSLLLGKREEFRPGEAVARPIARAFAFLTPSKYKPVSARQLGRKIVSIAARKEPGTIVYQGKDLY